MAEPTTRDFRLLLIGRILRAFAFGFSAILLGFQLQSRGLQPAQIGFVLAVGLASAALSGLLAALASSRFGRRVTLAAIGVLMAVCGLDLAFSDQFGFLVLAGLTGMMGVSGTDAGPFLNVEQSLLTDAVAGTTRNRAFARYSLTGALAGSAGALAAAAGTSPARTQVFFVSFAVLGLVTAVIPLLISTRVERPSVAPAFGSLRPLLGLSGLFALDSLGSGLVANAVLVYLLHVRFHATPAALGPSFALMSLLSAFSFELAGRLADRIGLINTMVFTHLPSSLLLVLVPFLPGLNWVLAVLVARSLVVSMDQPARQAYIVSIVKPHERSGALALTGAIRGTAGAFGPVLAGIAIQTAMLSLPFVIGGLVKSTYDLGLYFGFRRRPGDHELAQ
jgi:MFS family permease